MRSSLASFKGLAFICAMTVSLFAHAQFQSLPHGTVTVVVQDPNGKPIPNAEVHCVDQSFDPRFTDLEPGEKGITDAQGRVTFHDKALGYALARVKAGELGGWFGVGVKETTVKVGLGRTVRVNTQPPGVLVLAHGCLPIGVTDEHGQLSIPNVGIGYLTELAFTKEGCAWTTYSQQPDLPAVVNVRLALGTDVEGTVVAPDGKPAVGANVNGGPFREDTITTDKNGHFRLGRLPHGEYGAKTQICSIWQQNGVQLWASTNIELQQGTVTPVTLQLAPLQNRTYTLRGQVLRSGTGMPVQATIMWNNSDDLYCAKAAGTTDMTGSFSVSDVPEHTTWFTAVPTDPTLFVEEGMVTVLPKDDQPPADVVFHAREGCAIRGRVVTKEMAPVKEAQVHCLPFGKLDTSYDTGNDGRFLIANLDSSLGVFTVIASDKYQRQSTIKVGPLKKGEIFEAPDITIEGTGKPSKLRGTLKDATGEPISDLQLYFTYGQGDDLQVCIARPDDQGHYEANILKSGNVKVDVRAEMPNEPDDPQTRNVHYILPYGALNPSEVTTEAGKDANQDFTLSLGASPDRPDLDGRVRDESGHPLEARIAVIAPKGNARFTYHLLNGRFKLTEPPTPPFLVQVVKPGYQARVVEISSLEKAGELLDIRLKKGPYPDNAPVWAAVMGIISTKEDPGNTFIGNFVRKREDSYRNTAKQPEFVAQPPSRILPR